MLSVRKQFFHVFEQNRSMVSYYKCEYVLYIFYFINFFWWNCTFNFFFVKFDEILCTFLLLSSASAPKVVVHPLYKRSLTWDQALLRWAYWLNAYMWWNDPQSDSTIKLNFTSHKLVCTSLTENGRTPL